MQSTINKRRKATQRRQLWCTSVMLAMLLLFSPWLSPSASADTGNGSCAQAPNFTKDIGFGSQVAVTTSRTPTGLIMHDISQIPDQGQTQVRPYVHATWGNWGGLGKVTLDQDGYIYAVPQPWIDLQTNPPAAQRKILRVDTNTGVMSEWFTLPAAGAVPTNGNPYSILGLAYDCENHMLYAADVGGSTAAATHGNIFAIDIASNSIVSTLPNVDALGIGVSDADGTKKLYFGDARTNAVKTIALDANGHFTGAAQTILSVPSVNLHAGDISFQPDGKMIIPEVNFGFSLSNWGGHAQDGLRYVYAGGNWTLERTYGPGTPASNAGNLSRSTQPGGEYDPLNEMVWFSSNAVQWSPQPQIYGAAGFQEGDIPIHSSESTWLDYTTANNNIKGYMGDIQVAHRFMRLGNYVWIDANADGLQTPGEAPLAGVTLYLYLDGSSETGTVASVNQPGFPPNGDLDANDRLIATAVTDANGEYYFDGLVAGDYIVSVVPPAGYTNTGNANPAGADPDDNVGNDSNFKAGENYSFPITMVYNQEPSPNPDNPNFNDANYTVDFGFVPPPSIDVEKLTNGNQADSANGADVPIIAPGAQVQWTYLVENETATPIAMSDIDLVDDVLGTIMNNGAIVLGNAAFGNTSGIVGATLVSNGTFTIIVTDVAENLGSISATSSSSDEYVSGCDDSATGVDETRTTYENTATVSIPTGQDTDDSHYCNPPPSIDIEKTTNGNQADGASDADVPVVIPGGAVEWIYTITNDGLVDIPRADIDVSDNVVGNLLIDGAIQALAAPYTGAAFANDTAIQDNVLGPNESFTIRVTRTAEDLGTLDAASSAADEYVAGCNDPNTPADETRTTYENSATVTIPLDNDSDDSHYCNPPPSIEIQKTTNGNQADGANDADVPAIAPSAAVTWLYVVTNDGDVSIPMGDVDVVDNVVGNLMIDGALQALVAPYGGATFSNNAQIVDTVLGPNESFTIQVTWTAPDMGGNDPAASADDEWVLGCDDGATGADESRTTYHNNATVTIPLDTDNDDSHFCNTPPSIEIEKLTNGNQADTPVGADVPLIIPGDPVTWSYIVTNDGDTSIPMSTVDVSDNVIGALLNDGALLPLAAPYTGATFGNNAQIGDGILGPNESFTIEVTRAAEDVNRQDATAAANDEYVSGCDDAATALDETRTAYENSASVTIPTDTDVDDSHYCNPMPSIDIEKLTNANQADGANGADVPVVVPGDVITWTYIVLNDGTTDIPLTDIDVDDNVVGNLMTDGILAALGLPYTGVSYADNASIQDGVLGAGESFTLLVLRFAEDLGTESAAAAANDEYILGCNDPATAADETRITYMNSATVAIPLGGDSDDSHYCNPLPSIEIEKDTNGNQADGANDSDVPQVLPGAAITWTYVIANDGDVSIPMGDIDVADNVVGALITNGALQPLAAPYGGATFSDNVDIADGFLAADESFSVDVTWTAPDMGAINAAAAGDEWVLGCDDGSTTADETRTTYENSATVSVPGDSDSDDSHFCNPLPIIEIEKLTNGNQADGANDADVPVVDPGAAITWSYIVTNDGDVSIALGDIDVSDNIVGDLMIDGVLQALAAPYGGATYGNNSQIADNVLSPGESFTILATWTAPDLGVIDHAADAADQWVLGCDDGSTNLNESRTTYLNRATVAIPTDEDSDDSHFCNSLPSIEIEKLTNGNQADGASDADVPVVTPGDAIAWTFVVSNDGQVSIPMADVDVNDNVLGNLMIAGALQALAVPYTGATFDNNSQIGDNVLQPGESFTLLVSRTAEDLGQHSPLASTMDEYVMGCNDPATGGDESRITYENSATVTIPLDTDQDDSHYCNPVPSIDVEKSTNNNQADDANDADVPIVTPGDAIEWLYTVTNDGNVSIQLSDVDVSDNIVGDLVDGGVLVALVNPYTGVSYKTNTDVQDGILGPGESFVLSVLRTAEDMGVFQANSVADDQYIIGCDNGATASNESRITYMNSVTVTIPLDEDLDDSHYCNPDPSIDIEKLTNGNQADGANDSDVPEVLPGAAITWTFIVLNDGEVTIPLTDISVSDDVVGDLLIDGVLQVLAAPYTGTTYSDDSQILDGFLAVGESFSLSVLWIAPDMGAVDASADPTDEFVRGCDDLSTQEDEGRAIYENSATVTIPFDSDSDDSHFCNPESNIDVEKLTNGNQADGASAADVPEVLPGDPITWTYLIANYGQVSIALGDISLNDNIVGDLMINGALQALAAPYAGVTYGNNMQIQDNVLGPNESFTVQATWTAPDMGQIDPNADATDQWVIGCDDPATPSDESRITYENRATVTTPLDSDSDDSHLCNPVPSIDIEKLTNGNQADGANDADVPVLNPGDQTTWSYIITNDGDVSIPMNDVDVNDNIVGDLMLDGALQFLAAPYSGVTFGNDTQILDGMLAPTESFTLLVERNAEDLGSQSDTAALDDEYVIGCNDPATAADESRIAYANSAIVTIPLDEDQDDSHYCNPMPSIEIEKLTNGHQADGANDADVPVLDPNDAVEWLYIVTNDGDVSIPMHDVDVSDDVIGSLMQNGILGVLGTPYVGASFADNADIQDDMLAPGESFTLAVDSAAEDLGTVFEETDADDQYVLGCDDGATAASEARTIYENSAIVTIPLDADQDDSHYCNPLPSIEIEKLTNGNQADGANDSDVPEVLPGETITWTFIVTNDGTISIPMTDTNVVDNVVGTLVTNGEIQTLAAPYGGATYSNDADMLDGFLAAGETFSIQVSWTLPDLGAIDANAAAGDEFVRGCNDQATGDDESRTTYVNSATVTIPFDSDVDNSHICNPLPTVDIEKLTNGNQADGASDADVPVVAPGGTITWTYIIANDSDVSILLSDIDVTDNVVGDLMIDGALQALAAPYGGAIYGDDSQIIDNVLNPNETFSLLVTWTAPDLGVIDHAADGSDEWVQGCDDGLTNDDESRTTYMNSATVSIPMDSDSDDSHFCNPAPSIEIEKLTNGNQADGANDADVPVVAPGDQIDWTFIVTNDGDVSIPMDEVDVSDNVIGSLLTAGVLDVLAAPYTGASFSDNAQIIDNILQPGESFTLLVSRAAEDLGTKSALASISDEYISGCNDPATAGDESRITYENSATVTIPLDEDQDDSHFCNPIPRIDVEKSTNGNQADSANDSDVPVIRPGDPIEWLYTVVNDGDVSIQLSEVNVSDNVVGDLMADGVLVALANPYAGVSYDANGDVQDGILGAGESFTLSVLRTAEDMGFLDVNDAADDQYIMGCGDDSTADDESRITYMNSVTVTIPLDNDLDDSHYCNPEPSIDIEKLTNGNQADGANDSDVPELLPSDEVVWSFIVLNDGDVTIPMSDVSVTDDVVGSLMISGTLQSLTAPYTGTVYSDNGDVIDGFLSAGESFTLQVAWSAPDMGAVDAAADAADEFVLGCNDLATAADESRTIYENSAIVTIPLDSDADDSHFCNPESSIDIEKLTNGNQADGASAEDVPEVLPGDPITWTYIIANYSDVSIAMSDIDVSDNVVGDLMITGTLQVLGAPYGGVAFGDDSQVSDGVLGPNETFTLLATWTAPDMGQIDPNADAADEWVLGCDNGATPADESRITYENRATVITPLDSDSDDSHVCNPMPSIEIEKLTNGNQADDANHSDVPVLMPGDVVTWTYIIANDGDISIPMANVDVMDNVIGDLMLDGSVQALAAPYAGATFGDDSQILDSMLSPGETFTLSVSRTAEDLGLESAAAAIDDEYVIGCDDPATEEDDESRITYMNSAMVTIPLDSDSDDSHYCNPMPSIEIEKSTNGNQADGANDVDVPVLNPNDPVEWLYVVTNDGEVSIAMSDVDVSDNVVGTLMQAGILGVLGNPYVGTSFADNAAIADNVLAPGESFTLRVNSSAEDLGVILADADADDQYVMGCDDGTTDASEARTIYENSAVVAIPLDEDQDDSHYCNPIPSIEIEKLTNGNQADGSGDADVPVIAPGDAIAWRYIVTNDGLISISMMDVDVVDSVIGSLMQGGQLDTLAAPYTNVPMANLAAENFAIADGVLGVGETFVIEVTSIAQDLSIEDVDAVDTDQYILGCDGVAAPNAKERITYINSAGVSIPLDNDSDDSHYCNPLASIGDVVWYDDNRDGVQDAGEAGVEGVTVELLDENGQVVGTTVTDASGAYLFDNLVADTYSIRFVTNTIPGGYVISPQDAGNDDAADSDADPATGETVQTDLAPGEHDPTWDMGIHRPVASIGDTVWFDANADGIQDPSEDGVENVTVNLYSVDDNGNEILVGTTSTDSNGYYEFTQLEPGDYFVEFVPPTGYEISPQDAGGDDAVDSDMDPLTGRTEVTTLDSGEHDPTWDAGIYMPSSIGDYVWFDGDQDGIQDAWETGVAGVDVTLYGADGTAIATTQTDADGYYLFDDLMPGDYYLGFELPNGYTQSPTDAAGDPGEEDVYDSDPDPVTQLTPITTLDPGEHDPTWDMGIYLSDGSIPASIGDYVWFDANADGVQDASESGIGGVIATLHDSVGNVIAQDVTDGDGYYGFDNLAPGDYYVDFTPPAGYLPTGQNAGADDAIDSDMNPVTGETPITTLDPGEHDPTWDAGFYLQTPPASIGDTVWFDSNADGIQDAGETGIAGVTVDLYSVDANGNEVLVGTTATDGNGYYDFTNLVPGDYFVEFTPPAQYLPSPQDSGADDAADSDMDPITGRTEVTTLDPGEHDPTWDAGFHLGLPEVPTASIGDYVWFDTEQDGEQDADETGVAGVEVMLYTADGTLVATTETDADGAYLFDNLTPDNYYLDFELPAGYTQSPTDSNSVDNAEDSDPDQVNQQTPITTLEPGEHDPTWDMGIYLSDGSIPASIGDYVWFDTNADGVQDAGESGIAGVTVLLIDADGNVIAQDVTDGDGLYGFDNLVPGDYSVQFVAPAGYLPSPQDSGADDAADSDMDPLTGQTIPTTLDPGENDPTWDAGFYLETPPASIGDTVWLDTNADGIQESDEDGIENVTVDLYSVDANGDEVLIATTTTDGDGYYEFINLVPGDYFVEFTPPAGYLPSPQDSGSDDAADSDMDPADGRTEVTTLEPGEHDPTWDAGFYPGEVDVTLPASIGDTVWYDTNHDGIQDADESGVEGIVVHLYNELGEPIATTTTDADGHYEFTNLVPGDYFVEFVPPTSYVISPQDAGGDDAADSDMDPNTGRTILTTLDPGENDPNWDAGIYQIASIGDTVWYDTNMDGIQDAGESGVEGVTVQLYDANGDLVAETTTDANGYYEFTELNPGEYAVTFVPPAGYIMSPQNAGDDDATDSDADPQTGETELTMLDAEEHDPTWDAGIFQLASIGDTVWYDTNADGIQAADEVGVEGVTVQLVDSNGDVVDETTTDADGYYEFAGLVPGEYSVTFVPPAGYLISPQDAGDDDAADSDADPETGETESTTLDPVEHDPTWDAGLFELASIGDTVWLDVDADGVQDAGESGIPGVTVQLYDGNGDLVAETMTDVNGNYEFTELMPGDYSITFVPPTGYEISPQDAGDDDSADSDLIDSDADPITGSTQVTTLTSGENDPTWDAGLYQLASIGDVVWYDTNQDGVQDAMETGIPGTNTSLGVPGVLVTLYSVDDAGNEVIVGTQTTDSSGYYEFTGLTPGDYFVEFEMPTGYELSPSNSGSDDFFDSDVDAVTMQTPITMLESGEHDPTLDMGIYLSDGVIPASIGDTVWFDVNADGIQDANEPGIQGVMVTLLDGDGNIIAVTTTNADGEYGFTGLVPGDYAVEFSAPAGYLPSPQDVGNDDGRDSDMDPFTGQTVVTTLEPGENDPTWDAGFYMDGEAASIGNYVWLDLDESGTQDTNESGVPGVVVTLYTADGTPVAEMVTSADGYYFFDNLVPGDYYVEFVPPIGYEITRQDATGETGPGDLVDSDVDPLTGRTDVTTLEAGESDLTWDAGLVMAIPATSASFIRPAPATVGDFVWFDEDQDGIQDTSEAGVEGVIVKLYDADGELVASTQTDEQGAYLFDNLVPGDYYIEFVTPADYALTQPNQGDDPALNSDADLLTGRTTKISLEAGERDMSWDAGIYPLDTFIDGRIWPDIDEDGVQDANEAGLSGIQVTLLDEDGQSVQIAYTNEMGDYLFNNLEPGEYIIEVDLPLGFKTQIDERSSTSLNLNSDGQTPVLSVTTLTPLEDLDVILQLVPSSLDTVGEPGYAPTSLDTVGEPGSSSGELNNQLYIPFILK